MILENQVLKITKTNKEDSVLVPIKEYLELIEYENKISEYKYKHHLSEHDYCDSSKKYFGHIGCYVAYSNTFLEKKCNREKHKIENGFYEKDTNKSRQNKFIKWLLNM
jgi:hypothetical protein